MLLRCLHSEVTTAHGDVMTSWESLYLDGTWATDDDDDDGRAPEASHPHADGRIEDKNTSEASGRLGCPALTLLDDVLFSVCRITGRYLGGTGAYLKRPYLSPPARRYFPTVVRRCGPPRSYSLTSG